MRADWDQVHRMLTDPRSPRRDAQGRDVYEVWADLVLSNPPVEYARAAQSILPPEPVDSATAGAVVTSIQNLYLSAVVKANRMADPRVVEALAEKPDEPEEW
jgi:hypothetical protein